VEIFLNELVSGLPDGAQAARVFLRLLIASFLAAIIGYEREASGKSAGLRTHMLVSLASAIFVLAPLEAGMSVSDASRVIQGVAAGIGFIGAGAILKGNTEHEIHGLTTAAGLWMTAAVGMAAGVGRFGLAVMSVAFAWVILAVLSRLGR
jgi:putative Mg2+ transporter-C (MgtC) family protein